MATKRKIPFQVYLSEKEEAILNSAANQEGLSKSDIIRRLIRRLDFQLGKNQSLDLDSGLIIDDYVSNLNEPKSELINSRSFSKT
jgi:hypothetical protein